MSPLLLASLTALSVLIIVLAPFVLGAGGSLAASSAQNSVEELAVTKKAILYRFLKDEASFQAKQLSAREWTARKAFLLHRYIDAARRLDFLKHSDQTHDHEGQKRV